MDLIEKLESIADHYGYEVQSRQAQEECAELIQAINKLARSKNAGKEEELKAKKAVIEEIADVKLMITQLAYLLDAEADVIIEVENKIERQIQRIEEAEEKKRTYKVVRCMNCGETTMTNREVLDGERCTCCKGGPLRILGIIKTTRKHKR